MHDWCVHPHVRTARKHAAGCSRPIISEVYTFGSARFWLGSVSRRDAPRRHPLRALRHSDFDSRVEAVDSWSGSTIAPDINHEQLGRAITARTVSGARLLHSLSQLLFSSPWSLVPRLLSCYRPQSQFQPAFPQHGDVQFLPAAPTLFSRAHQVSALLTVDAVPSHPGSSSVVDQHLAQLVLQLVLPSQLSDSGVSGLGCFRIERAQLRSHDRPISRQQHLLRRLQFPLSGHAWARAGSVAPFSSR